MQTSLYRPSLATLTDLYELTMGQAYFDSARAHDEAIFHLFFRQPPFDSGFTVAAGLAEAVRFLREFEYRDEDIQHLATLTGAEGTPLFTPAYLDFLQALEPGLGLDLDAVPEGTVVFPYEPIVRVRGRIIMAQLIETALLNLINFPTLVATNAARVVLAAGDDPVLEFGLRRAQGPDGGLTASRAAYLGGCAATSNVLAGRLFGIPVRGTHAHSWVLSWRDEQEAFDAWSTAQPQNAVLLVDTFDTLEGVKKAIETARRMRAAGRELRAIRLDSGDLAYLSSQARALLDEAGLTDVRIIVSNDLDAETIASLKEQGARIDEWAVGTRLVTAYEQPALGGVYKLTAVRSGPDATWRPTIKVSSDPGKTTVPGILGVKRFFDADGQAAADMIHDTLDHDPHGPVVVSPTNAYARKSLDDGWRSEELLVPVLRDGNLTAELPSLEEARARARAQLASFHPGVLRQLKPHRYPAGLEFGLHNRREALVEEALSGRGVAG